MPKTAVQTPACDICGADVREGSLFCYNCGGSLKQAAIEKPEIPPPAAPVPAATNGSGAKKPEDRAAARRRRNVERGPVEVIWEPREGISVPFVIAGIFLLVIALVLFVIAMWLK